MTHFNIEIKIELVEEEKKKKAIFTFTCLQPYRDKGQITPE